MHIRRFVCALAATSLLAGGLVGCEGDEGSVPDSADQRLKAATQSLPADAQMSFIFSDLEKFRSATKDTKATVDRLTSTENMLTSQTRSGFAAEFMGEAPFTKLLEKKFWKDRGVAPNSSVAISAVDYNQVIHTYVNDKKAFEKAVTGEKKANTKSIKVAGQSAKKFETDDKTVVWSYDGKLLTLVYPSDEMATGDSEPAAPKATLKRVLETADKDDAESLHATSGFQKFRDAAGDRPSLIYLNLQRILEENQNLEGESDSYKKYAKAMQESVDGGGLIVETSDQKRISTRIWVGMTEEGKKQFDETFQTSVAADFPKFATDNTLMAMRLELDWSSVWESVPSQQRKLLESQFAGAAEATGLEMQKDIIDNLDGQAGVFVYGIGGKSGAELMQNPMGAVSDLEALYMMKFGDAETLSKIAESVAGLSEKYLDLRPLQAGEDGEKIESIDVLDIKIPPGGMQNLTGMSGEGAEGEPQPAPARAYFHEDTMMIAASAIPEANIRTMLTGKGDATTSLTESKKLDLGKKFANTERLSGVYVNFDRMAEVFGDILDSGMVPPSITEPADKLEEGLLSTESKEKGVFVDLSIDLAPKEGGSGEGSESGKGSSEDDDSSNDEGE